MRRAEALGAMPLVGRLRSSPVLSGPALVGKHILKVLVQLDGLEALHIRGYRFEVRSSHAIQVEPGKPVDLSVILYEKNLSAPAEERPAIRYAEH